MEQINNFSKFTMADFVALATKFVEFLPEIARTRSTTR